MAGWDTHSIIESEESRLETPFPQEQLHNCNTDTVKRPLPTTL